jgi:hypothetical protein
MALNDGGVLAFSVTVAEVVAAVCVHGVVCPTGDQGARSGLARV